MRDVEENIHKYVFRSFRHAEEQLQAYALPWNCLVDSRSVGVKGLLDCEVQGLLSQSEVAFPYKSQGLLYL